MQMPVSQPYSVTHQDKTRNVLVQKTGPLLVMMTRQIFSYAPLTCKNVTTV